MTTCWDAPFCFELERKEISKCVVEQLLKMMEGKSADLLFWNFGGAVPSLMITPRAIQKVENIRQQFDKNEGCELSDEQAQLIYKWLIGLEKNAFEVTSEGIAELIRLIEAGVWYLVVMEATEGALPERIPSDIADPINLPWMFCSNPLPYDLEKGIGELRVEGIGIELQKQMREAKGGYEKKEWRSCMRSIFLALNIISLICDGSYEDCGKRYYGLRRAYMIPVSVHYVFNGQRITLNSTTPWLVDDLLYYIFQMMCMVGKCNCNSLRITHIKGDIMQLRELLEPLRK